MGWLFWSQILTTHFRNNFLGKSWNTWLQQLLFMSLFWMCIIYFLVLQTTCQTLVGPICITNNSLTCQPVLATLAPLCRALPDRRDSLLGLDLASYWKCYKMLPLSCLPSEWPDPLQTPEGLYFISERYLSFPTEGDVKPRYSIY